MKNGKIGYPISDYLRPESQRMFLFLHFQLNTTTSAIYFCSLKAKIRARLVRFCRDLGLSVKRNKNQFYDYMATGPARLAEILACCDENFPCNRVHLHIWEALPQDRVQVQLCDCDNWHAVKKVAPFPAHFLLNASCLVQKATAIARIGFYENAVVDSDLQLRPPDSE